MRTQSQAKVDKGSPRCTVRLGRVGRGKESRVDRRRRRTKSKKILSTPLGNRRAAAWNEGAKRMRTRDERAKRERQIDRKSGRLEWNRRERRMREAAIYASQKSPTKRARPLSEELRRRENGEKIKN